jgi:ferredoxin-NADP reductase
MRRRDRFTTGQPPAGGNFQGSLPRGRPEVIAGAAAERLEGRWSQASRYDRRAVMTGVEPLAPTGTVRVGMEVADGRPFAFQPGNFVGIEAEVDGGGWRRSPYCLLTPPVPGHRRFDLLVRVVPEGPLSRHLAGLRPGDEVAFRGPTGRSMVPRDRSRDLVLVATGVGISPFHALAAHLLDEGFDHRIELFWGLRLAADICLTAELDRLADAHPNFRYRISLSRPPAGWSGLRGRVTESVPPVLERVGGTSYVLCGNGAMIEEVAAGLSEVGVERRFIHEEPFFNARHVAERAVVAAIRDRFTAADAVTPGFFVA